jgi:endonuclease/exonuclease/phosphatase family metal-dependent hydrolase
MLRTCGADVVALQELSQSRADEIEKELPDYFSHRSMFPGGFAGKAVLSRFPIVRAIQTHLGYKRPDLLVTLVVGSKEISAISAHPPPPRLHLTGFHFDQPTLD